THEHSQSVVSECLEENHYPVLLRQSVFALLGLSGVFAVLAGLSVLVSASVLCLVPAVLVALFPGWFMSQL
ncbi:MAG: hypothetical protein ACXW2G_07645, partial [Burkholderiaceae bacterium]